MTSTNQARQAALVAATVPFALTNLGNHMLDHELPAPRHIDVPGRGPEPLTVWLNAEHADAWLTDGITVAGVIHGPSTVGGTRHEARGVLHGSCIAIRIMWHTLGKAAPTLTAVPAPALDHVTCQDADCDRTLCYCEQPQRCDGTVDAGCDHLAEFYCETHRGACVDCQVESAEGLARFGGGL